MRLMLLKPLVVGKSNHDRGDVVEVDPIRGKALVKAGAASEINSIGPIVGGDLVQDSIELRQATLPPAKRKSRKG